MIALLATLLLGCVDWLGLMNTVPELSSLVTSNDVYSHVECVPPVEICNSGEQDQDGHDHLLSLSRGPSRHGPYYSALPSTNAVAQLGAASCGRIRGLFAMVTSHTTRVLSSPQMVEIDPSC